MDKMDLRRKALFLRKQFGVGALAPIDDIFSLVSNKFDVSKHLTTIFYPMGERLSGMCIKGEDNIITIAINSDTTVGRQHFSMAHELFHVYFDNNQATTVCFNKTDKNNKIEMDADQFASYFLISADALTFKIIQLKQKIEDSLTIENIVELEQYFRVSRLSILCRLQDEKEITEEEEKIFSKHPTKSAIDFGYSDVLYKPLPKKKLFLTQGYYLEQVRESLKKDLISNGRYEELLLEAFMPDFVYGGNLNKFN